MDKPIDVVLDSFIPPYTWFSKCREIRFQLIFRVFEELFAHPEKYPFPMCNFQLYVDGFYDNGKDLHARILIKNGLYFFEDASDFTVPFPEADQAMFHILKFIEFPNCIIKYKDNDILLSALINCKEVCSNHQSVYLQNLASPQIGYNLLQLYESISEDQNLSQFQHPVQTLIFSLLCLGFNDYSGRLHGLSSDIAYRALKKLKNDLAYKKDCDACYPLKTCAAHWPFLV